MEALHREIRLLYTGRSKRAVRFRYALVLFDLVTIVFFIVTAAIVHGPVLITVNMVIGVLILADFAARLWIAPDRKKMLRQVYTLADIVVIIALLAAPFATENLALLRVLRGLRLIHSYHLLRDLRRDVRFFRVNEDAVLAGVNLFVFIFVTTSLVYVLHFGEEASVARYIDALYFTVATLTTTGFGDITMTTPAGKLLSVFIMVFGVALFVRLAQTVFQPRKVSHKCGECGLLKHDKDAVHCKHCGERLNIETEGVD